DTALHPVPPEAFSVVPGASALKLNLTKNDFNRAPVFQRQQIASAAGNEAQARRIYQVFGQTWRPAAGNPGIPISGQVTNAAGTSAGQVHLVLANELIGWPVTNPNQDNIGQISDFLVDLKPGELSAASIRACGC